MIKITEIMIADKTSYSAAKATVKLSTGDYQTITVELNEAEIAEVQNTVREILATQLRRPIIEAKRENAFSLAVAGNTLYPAEQKTDRPGTQPEVEEFPDEYCTTHGRFHDSTGCPACAEAEANDFNARARGFKPEDKI